MTPSWRWGRRSFVRGSCDPTLIVLGALTRLQVEEEAEVIQVGVEAVRRWLAEAIKHGTDALVGFYY
jgi:hypothetical protein